MRWLRIAAVPVLVVLCFSSSGADNDSRRAVPDMPAQAVAEQRIKELVTGAPKGAERSSRAALAKQMMGQAELPESDSAVFYVLLKDAQSGWAKAGDVRLALDAEKRLSETFKLPEAESRSRKLTIVVDGLRSGQRTAGFTALELLEQALDLGDEALALGDLKEAARAAQVSQSAQQTKDPLLTLRARSLARQIEAAQKQRTAADGAELRLKLAPEDVAANVTVGRYQCFIANDWANGLAHLARSSDPAIRAATEKELAARGEDPSPEALRAAADAWWNVFRHPGQIIPPDLACRRAVYWYRKLLPSQTGTQRLQLQARLKEGKQDFAGQAFLMRNYERDGVEQAFCMDDPRVPDELQLSITGGEVRIGGTKRNNAIDINGQLVAHCGKAVFLSLPRDTKKFWMEGALTVGAPREADGTHYLGILLDKTGHIKYAQLPVNVGKLYTWHLSLSDDKVTLAIEDDGKSIGSVDAPLAQIKAFGFGSNVRYPGNKSDMRIEFQ